MKKYGIERIDIQSSIVVFLVALPLCLGISLASGAPISSGLISGIVGGVVVGFLSPSSLSVSGPAAGLTVLVVSSIAKLGGFEAFTVAVILAGILQIFLGLFRAGSIGGYFPNAVIKGMLAAIGFILILKQVPHLIGFDLDFMGDENFLQNDGHNTFSELFYSLDFMHLGATFIGLLSIAVIIFWKWNQFIPAPLIVVVGGIGLNELLAKMFPAFVVGREHLVQIPVEGIFNLQNVFNESFFKNPDLYLVAATLAIVASLETLLSIDAADKIDPLKRVTNKNRELVAQGVGNILSGSLGGIPLTAVIVRTSANVNAGAKGKWSCILHGLWLLLAVVCIPHVLSLIPLSSLAAILIMTGYKLVKPSLFIDLWKKGKGQFFSFVITIVAIMITDLLTGIFVGMGMGLLWAVKANNQKVIVSVEDGDHFLIRFSKDISFLQKPALGKLLRTIPANTQLIIDGGKGIFIDEDIIDTLQDFIEMAPQRNIKVEVMKSSLSLNSFFKEKING